MIHLLTVLLLATSVAGAKAKAKTVVSPEARKLLSSVQKHSDQTVKDAMDCFAEQPRDTKLKTILSKLNRIKYKNRKEINGQCSAQNDCEISYHYDPDDRIMTQTLSLKFKKDKKNKKIIPTSFKLVCDN